MTQERNPKKRGASMIFVNASNEILLFLRDDYPSIPYPNCWDILGGAVEPGETPEQCIIREMMEEIEYRVRDPQLFKVTEFDDRVEHTFFEQVDFNINEMPLHEGQRLKWFSLENIGSLGPDEIAFGFRPLILQFIATSL